MLGAGRSHRGTNIPISIRPSPAVTKRVRYNAGQAAIKQPTQPTPTCIRAKSLKCDVWKSGISAASAPTVRIAAVAMANLPKSRATVLTLNPLKVADIAYPIKIIPTISAVASPTSTPAKPKRLANNATEKRITMRRTCRILSSSALPDTRYKTRPSSDRAAKNMAAPVKHRANG